MVKKQVRDPLEEAIVGGETAPVPPASPTMPSMADPFAPTKAPEEPKQIAAPPPVAKAATSYKVLEQIRIPWFKGQFITLNPGDVVNDSLYGSGGVARLKDSGVKLEEV